jgi:hypothetical protein
LTQTRDGYLSLLFSHTSDLTPITVSEVQEDGYHFQLSDRQHNFIDIVLRENSSSIPYGTLQLIEIIPISEREFKESIKYQEKINNQSTPNLDEEVNILFNEQQEILKELAATKSAIKESIKQSKEQ